MKWLKPFGRSGSGATFVEAAVVLPLVIIVAAGAFDLARAFATISTAQRGLRDATRFLSTLPQQAVCGWGLAQARNLAIYGNTTGTGTAAIAGWRPENIILAEPEECEPDETIHTIRLTTRVSYSALIWQAVGLPSSMSFNLEHEERWLGQ